MPNKRKGNQNLPKLLPTYYQPLASFLFTTCIVSLSFRHFCTRQLIANSNAPFRVIFLSFTVLRFHFSVVTSTAIFPSSSNNDFTSTFQHASSLILPINFLGFSLVAVSVFQSSSARFVSCSSFFLAFVRCK